MWAESVIGEERRTIATSFREKSMIICDLCGEARDCLQKEIEGKEYDICSECWNPLAQKLRGKGRAINREVIWKSGTATKTLFRLRLKSAMSMLRVMLSLPPINFQSFTHGTWTEMASL